MKLRRALRLVVTASGCISFVTACSDDPSNQSDGGVPSDAGGVFDRAGDGDPFDAALDASHDAASPDARTDISSTPDSGCTCSPIDGRIPPFAAVPLSCYCDMKIWPPLFAGRPACPSYDSFLACPDRGYPFHVETYTNCNLVKVAYGLFGALDFNVYDATTHELVGAVRGIDDDSFVCGAGRTFGLEAGIVPGPECVVATTEPPCHSADGGEAGAPPNDADGGCACSMADAGGMGVGEQSLACYCASGSGLCPTYDEARTSCPPGPLPRFDRLDVHAACNLVIMTNGDGLGRTTHVFDATTHELVGASRLTDYAGFSCGSSRVYGYRAGTFPPPDCPVSQSISRCAADGGANPEGGRTSDAGCPCTLDDAGDNRLGWVSLPCYCSSLGSCPSYDGALRACRPGISRLEEYPACNLAVVTVYSGYSVLQYVYDYTTRELVGVREGGDVPTYACGSTSTYAYRAGVFPDTSCVRARTLACREADAGAADVTMDAE
jgi:hypothetical protein